MPIYNVNTKIKKIYKGTELIKKGYAGSNLVYTSETPESTIFFDLTSSNPANITGDVNAGAIANILSKAGRCLCKKTDNGKVTICRLKNDDGTKYYDNSAATLTGTQGDVMVYLPEFWYKNVKNGNVLEMAFSEIAKEGYVHVSASLVGAYKSYKSSSKLYSRSGVIPTTYDGQPNFISYAQARGTGYNIIDYYQHCMIALLFYAKYGTRNSQAVLGIGNANTSTNMGGTNSLGNRDTQNATTGWVNFLGIEGVYGVYYECMNGVIINNRVWTISGVDGISTRTVTAGSSDGWIKNIAAENGSYFDMIPIAVGGSETTYYTDYYTQSSANTVSWRSGSSNLTNDGISYIHAYYVPEQSLINMTSRLSFRGEITEETNVTTFKALPVL
ncbi:hypothetical protein EZS27_008668 [termite gut metagenome]|uniref:Uncharacterized protein n=1 Tax=termite gut metagenome TaxID=433724 RepID=A0A5J4SEE2_9ZZZZ